MVDWWGEIRVQKSIQDIIYWFIHRILMTQDFDGTEPSFIEYIKICLRLDVSLSEIGVQKNTWGIISFSLHNASMKFGHSRVPAMQVY